MIGELRVTAPVDELQLPPGTWPKQGEWTIDDWAHLPDDGNRYEIIDGVVYSTPLPWTLHQWVLGQLIVLLRPSLDVQTQQAKGLLFSTIGVLLPTGPVIPDLVYVHMRNIGLLTAKWLDGIPDLVIEIASPGTAAYDRREKQDAYALSGIPEYWWVEPANRTVEVLVLEQSGRYRTLGLVERQSTIPSLQLPGLQFPVERIFMPRDLLASLRPD